MVEMHPESYFCHGKVYRFRATVTTTPGQDTMSVYVLQVYSNLNIKNHCTINKVTNCKEVANTTSACNHYGSIKFIV